MFLRCKLQFSWFHGWNQGETLPHFFLSSFYLTSLKSTVFVPDVQYLTIDQPSMGNTQFQVPNNVREQWTHFTLNGRQYAQNLITDEVFQFKTLSMHNQSSISALIQRSIYSIPKTPKVIMLSDHYNQFFVLVQQGYSALAPQISKINNYFQILHLIRNIVSVIQVLFKKYGGFLIKQEMISVNINLDVMVWIHQEKQKSQVEMPLEYSSKIEQKMLENLLGIVQNYTNFNVFQHYFDHSFSAFLAVISEAIRRQFLRCTQRPNSRIKRFLTPEHPNTHRCEFALKNPFIDHQSQSAKGSMKMRATIKVPNFIKGVHDKKTALLDGMDHKRTITRQVSLTSNGLKPNKDLHAQYGLNSFDKIQQVQNYKFIPLSDSQRDLHHLNTIKKNSGESNMKTCKGLISSDEYNWKNIKKIGIHSERICQPVMNNQTSQKQMANFHSQPNLPVDSHYRGSNQGQQINQGVFHHSSPKNVHLDNLCINFAESKCFQNDELKVSFVQKFDKEQKDQNQHMQNKIRQGVLSHGKNNLSIGCSLKDSTINEEFKKIIDP